MKIESVSIALQKHMNTILRFPLCKDYCEGTAYHLVNGGVFNLTSFGSTSGGSATVFRINVSKCFRSTDRLQHHNTGLPSTSCNILLDVEIKRHNGDWLSYCTCTIPELFEEINCSTFAQSSRPVN